MVKIQVELERPISRDVDPTFTVELKTPNGTRFKMSGMSISDVDEMHTNIYKGLQSAKEHYKWLIMK